jgi:hypothetical protein
MNCRGKINTHDTSRVGLERMLAGVLPAGESFGGPGKGSGGTGFGNPGPGSDSRILVGGEVLSDRSLVYLFDFCFKGYNYS